MKNKNMRSFNLSENDFEGLINMLEKCHKAKTEKKYILNVKALPFLIK